MVKKKAKKFQKKKTIKKAVKKKVFKKISKAKVKAKAKTCKICKPVKKKAVSKKAVKKTLHKKAVVAPVVAPPPGILVGEIVHFYPNISVAVVEVKKTIKKGDKIHLQGKDISFTQHVESMQIDYKPVETAKKGDAIGMRVVQPVKEKVKVYLMK